MMTCFFFLSFLLMLTVEAQTPAVSTSLALDGEKSLDADPESALWRGAPAIEAERSAKDTLTPGHKTEIRSRWSKEHLYFLFICPYEELYLLPNPDVKNETNRLWLRDVAEIFIGADFEKIWQYKEYQVSPQGEWVDLDIDRKEPKAEGGWRWNSGFTVTARIDKEKKVWYGAMKIPAASITEKPLAAGVEFRVNYFRIQGPEPGRKFIAWRPTNATGNHHVPESFGLLRLVGGGR